jgi:hypothetical protein
VGTCYKNEAPLEGVLASGVILRKLCCIAAWRELINLQTVLSAELAVSSASHISF